MCHNKFMANITILHDMVQGLPTIITLDNSTIVSHASAINRIQVGTGYFTRGQVVDETLIGAAGIITTLRALGATS